MFLILKCQQSMSNRMHVRAICEHAVEFWPMQNHPCGNLVSHVSKPHYIKKIHVQQGDAMMKLSKKILYSRH